MRTGKTRRKDMTRDHIQQGVLDTVFNQGPAVLITGALTGIGRATALAFAREGVRIVVSGGHDDKGNALVAELQAIGAEAAFIKSDDRHDDEVRALVDETVKQLGRLDLAVNKGSTEGNPGPSTDQTAESYAAIVDTNVLSTLLSMKHELRVMLPQGSGSIVNVSCTCDRAGAPGSALYVASKHAVEGFTKAAALEFAETGVRINVVAPGTIETGMLNRFTGTPENKADLISRVPMKRIAQPEEIAEAILFLASMSLAADGGERSGSMDPPGIFEISRCRSFSASEWLLSLWHPGFLNFGTDFVRNSPNFATLSQRKSRSPHRERRPPRGGSFRRARDEEILRSIS
jgi:NAD(P)-dependent dehydrogenase (short-subunit alcohol dehydrogenase family)